MTAGPTTREPTQLPATMGRPHWTDRILAAWSRRSAAPMFSHGWGDWDAIRAVQANFPPPPSPPAEVTWGARARWRGVDVLEGSFDSPIDLLPDYAARARVLAMLPEGAELHDVPVCIALASSREQGYGLRQSILRPVVRRGVGALILENPYYGGRSLPDREPGEVRTVSEQLIMNRAAIEEGSALVEALLEAGCPRVVVAGFSMGGFTASFIALGTPRPLPVVAVATGGSASPIYTESLLAASVDWPALDDGTGIDAARAKLAQTIAFTNVQAYAAPADPSLAHLVLFESDGYVRPADVEDLHRHWPGSSLVRARGGHVTAMLWNRRLMQRSILALAAGRPT